MQTKTQSMTEMLDRVLKPSGSATAFIQALSDGSYRSMTFSEAGKLIASAETFLKNLGVKAGDHVVLVSPNSPELAAAIIASWRLGAVACPLDFRMTRAEMANVSKKIGARAVIIFKELLSNGDGHDWNNIENELAPIPLADIATIGSCQAAEREKSDFVTFKEPAFLILTSGTTGMPKGALHDLGSLLTNISELGQMAELEPGLKVLIPVPLSHVLGLEVLIAALLFGCTCVFSQMSMGGIVAANNKWQPEFLLGVPTIYGALLNLGKDKVDLSRARVLLCGGAPMPPSLAEDFEKHFQRRLNNGYGSTESKIIAVNIKGPVLSVGKIVPSCRVNIVDGEGRNLSDGQTGEVIICGDMLMLGYLGQEEATALALADGGYKTGDLGYIEDGYLYISGRAKELIIVAGNKVFPSEVEDALRKNPLVKEIAVIGVAHSKLGQLVKAHIVVGDSQFSEKLKSDAPETKKELAQIMKAFSQEHLKRELRPMDWQFYPEDQQLPRTFSGKIDKKQLS